jgi:hypothetical protein
MNGMSNSISHPNIAAPGEAFNTVWWVEPTAHAVRLTKSHWKQKSISLGTKRVSRQEVSSVALIVTKYPMTYTRNKKRRQFASMDYFTGQY